MKKNLHDKAFLEKYTTGYPQFEEYLLGKSDKIEKTAEWASGVCGVPAEQLEKLAEIFSSNQTMLMAGWGIQRQQYGEQKHWMLVTLAAMLGELVPKAVVSDSLITIPTVVTQRVPGEYCQPSPPKLRVGHLRVTTGRFPMR